MSIISRDQEIVAVLAKKIGAAKESIAKFDESGRIHELELSGPNLSQVPFEVIQLTNLRILTIGDPSNVGRPYSQLKQLPSEIGQLTNLEQLHLSGNKLQQLPPEIGQLTNLEQLHLRNNQLSQLPPEIGQLTNLKQLDLTGNELSQLPPEIGHLVRLRKLFLMMNQLSELPAEIWQLTNLEHLHLGGNQLTNIPCEIKLLINLQHLWIWENQLKELPPEIWQLTNLQMLNFHTNPLNQVPSNISQLTRLEELHLGSKQLKEFPPEIWQLTGLQLLSIWDIQLNQLPSEIRHLQNLRVLSLGSSRGKTLEGQLRQLPPEIGQLTKLEHLDVGDNQLRRLPPEIGQLTNLKWLNVDSNQLSQLPSEIGQLTNLEQLHLRNNQLSQLPPEIGQLTNLKQLHLKNNQLRQLPPEIGQLTNLQKLDLDDNPSLFTPPPEVVAWGTPAILAFLRELQQNSITRYESKLLIVGEGGTGKSSLLRALRNDAFDPHLTTTHGIEIDYLQLPYTHQNLILHTWDFGGQQIYHATHQFFLTKRSLYIVVWNARLGTGQGRLDYWLDTIKTLAPNVPILLVATHIDERSPDINYQLYKDAYPQLVGNLSVSNINGNGIAELKRTLTEQALRLPLMGQRWPQKWLDVEALLAHRQENYIDADMYMHCCSICGVEENVANGTLGNYLHDLGKILYFRDDYLLSNLVVLKPNWVTKSISRVLDNQAISEAKGIVLHADLPRIWTKDEDGQPFEPYLYPMFFRLMERFELSYQIEADLPGESITSSLIPQLLPHQPPIPLPPWPKAPAKDQSQVEMVYRLDFVPAGIMSRFIVRTHRYTKDLHWREGVMLEYQGHQARVELNPMLRELKLLVQGSLPQNFFTILMNTIDVILARFEGLTVRREIPCICHRERSVEPCPRFYRYEDLVRRMEAGKHIVECPDTLVEVSVPMLLYGIHSSTNEQVIADIKHGQQEIQKQLTDLHKLDIILEKMDQQSELIGRNFTRQWNLEMAKMEAECPNTFILMLGSSSYFNLKNWLSQEYQLFLVCQHPPQPHAVEHSYPLRQAEEWWVTISPWLNRLIKFLKFGVPMGKALGAVLDEVDVKKMQNAVDLLEEITKNIPIPPILDSMDRNTTVPILHREQNMVGPALRALHNYLDVVDPPQIWGGLHKIVSPDGHILWLCDKHRQHYQDKPLQLDT